MNMDVFSLSNKEFLFRSPRIIFGKGKISTIGEHARAIAEKGKHDKINAFLVTGKSSLKKSGYLDKIVNWFEEANISAFVYNEIGSEPTTYQLNRGKELAIQNKIDIII